MVDRTYLDILNIQILAAICFNFPKAIGSLILVRSVWLQTFGFQYGMCVPDVCTDTDIFISNANLYSELGAVTTGASDRSFTKETKRRSFSDEADSLEKFIM